MAGNNQNIKIDVELGSVDSVLKSFSTSLGDSGIQIDKLAASVVKFNKEGNPSRVFFKGLAEDLRAVTVEAKVQDGALRLMNARISESRDKLVEQARAAREAAAALRLIEGNKVAQSFVGSLGIDTAGVDAKFKDALDRTQRNLAKALSNKGVGQDDLNQVFQDLNNGIVKAETGVRGRLQAALLAVLKTQKDINAEILKQQELTGVAANATAGEKLSNLNQRLLNLNAGATTNALRSLFPAPPNATLTQLAAYEARLTAIGKLITDGKLSRSDVFSIASSVNEGKVLSGLSPEGNAVQSMLASLRKDFADVQVQGQKAFDTIGSAFGRLENIVSRLLIRNAIFALLNAFKVGITSAVELQQKIGEVEVASQGTGLGFQRLSEEIRRLSDNTGLKQLDLASAAVQVFQQRATQGAEGLALLNQATRLGIATNSTAENSVKALSEVLNAYGLSNQRAEATSALLFRTAQVGHSSLTDVGNALARTGSTAQALGISVNEAAGFIAALGQSGQTASQAAGVLDGIMQRLLNPSKELQQVFQRWGVITGEVAVSQLGLTGVLQRLFTEMNGDISRLDQLVGGFRNLASTIGPNGAGFSQFVDRTREVSDGLNRMNQAFEVSRRNTGRQIQEEFTKIGNFFSNDIGAKFITTLNSVSQVFGGLSGLIKILTGTLVIGGTAWAAYRLAMLATSAATTFARAATIAQTNALAATTGATNVATASTIRFRAALLGLLSVGGLTLIISLLAGFALNATASTEALGEAQLNVINRVREAQTRANTETVAAEERRRQVVLDTLRAQTQGVQNFAAAAQRVGRTISDILGDSLKRVTENLKLVSDEVLDQMKQKLADIRREASQSRSEIEKSKRLVEGFKERSEGRFFQQALGLEQDPDRAIILLNRRIQTLSSSARQLFSQGNRESVDAARKQFDEIEKLIEERFQRQVTLQRERAQNPLSAGTLAGGRQVTDSAGVTRTVIDIDVSRPQREINTLIAERSRLESEYQVVQARTRQQAQRNVIVEQIRQSSIQRAITDLANFSIFNQQGEVDSKFQGATPEERIRKALAEFDRRSNVVRQLVGPDVFRQLDQLQHLTQQRFIISQQAEAAITSDELRQQQVRLENLRQHLQAQQELRNQALVRAQESARGSNTGVGNALTSIDTLLGRTTSTGQGGINVENSQLRTARNEAIEALRAVQNINREITATQGRTGGIVSDEQITRLQNATVALQDAFNRIGTVAQGVRNVNLEAIQTLSPAQGSNAAVTSADVFRNLGESIRALQRNAFDFRAAQTLAQSTQTQLLTTGNQLVALQGRLAGLPGVAAEAARAMNAGIQSTSDNVNTLATRIERLARALEQLRSATPGGGPRPGLPVPGAEPTIPRIQFAEGGFVPGSGRGDVIPAMLEPGEYVWSRDTVSRFAPLIHALNSTGTPPQEFNSGGPVTNVGDINVTVTGVGNSPEAIGREVAQSIRREIRRGTFSARDLQ